jgi:hypothetical protein
MAKNWQIARRTFLRGLGTVVALPLLDAMAPSMTRAATAAASAAGSSGAAGAIPKRMAFVYLPNGINMAYWTPAAAGANYTLPATLAPLNPHKDDILVISKLAQRQAFGLGDGGGDHARASATYLTGVHPKKTAGADIKAGISVDQIAANHMADQTRFASLELSCDKGQEAGSCDSGYSCAYQFNISWRSETQPMNPEIDPQAAFQRLFGAGDDGETAEARAKRQMYDTSVLDYVQGDAKALQGNLGATDRRKLDEYFSAIREVEKLVASNGTPPPAVPDGEAPDFNANYTFERHMRLMFDIMTLAFQTDSTRVSTFIVGHDGSNRPYPFADVPQGHHHLSHHQGKPAALASLAKIDLWHTTQFAYFLQKLKGIKEGEGTLLDNCMIVYGGGICDGNAHNHDNLPIVLAGRGGGTIQPGRHLVLPGEVPMGNLYLSMLDRLGVPAEHIGDSTGRLEAIAHA